MYEGRSLGCMRPYTLPRRGCIWLVENKFFDFFILATILCKYDTTHTPRTPG